MTTLPPRDEEDALSRFGEWRPSEVASLLAAAAPPTLSNLTLDWFTLEDRDVEALAVSDRLARLVDLELHQCALSLAAKERLLTAEPLSQIPSIRIDADWRREP